MGRITVTLLIFFSSFFYQLNAQNNFVGKTVDEQNLILEDVLVVIKDSISNKILFHSYTNSLGLFYFEKDLFKSTPKTIHFNLLGYTSKTLSLNSILLNPNIVLESNPTLLNEVILESKTFIKKKDTITYFADRFKDGSEDNVEDLLKKIPGLVIEADGTIKIGNKEVERVMVDGDDFFEKGYKILTKSMPAYPIQTIELIDKYSKNKHLKNIENSDKVALNITLKEDFKGKWFGNILAGISERPSERYEIKSNVMNFKKKHKFFLLSNFNSIGFESFDDLKKINPSDDYGDLFTNQDIQNIINMNVDKTNYIKPERFTFNNSNLISLNSVHNTDNLKIKFNSFLVKDHLNYEINKKENFFLNNITNNNDINYNLTNSDVFSSVQIESDINQSLNSLGQIFYQKGNDSFRGGNNFNNLSYSELNAIPEKNYGFKNDFTYKIDSLSAVIVHLESKHSELSNDYSLKPVLYLGFFENLYQELNQKTFQSSTKNHFSFNYFKKNHKDRLFEASFSFLSQKQILNTDLYLDNQVNQDFKNNIELVSNIFSLNFKYNYKFRKLNFSSKLQIESNSNELENNETFEKHNFFFVKPSMGLNYQFNDKNTLAFDYTYDIFLNSTNNLNKNYIHDGFRNIFINNNDFKDLSESSFGITHVKVDFENKIFFTSIARYMKSHHYISNNTFISQDVIVNENYFVKNRNFATFISNVDYYYSKISSTLKMSNGFSFMNYENIINEESRLVDNRTYFNSLSVHSMFLGRFNFITESRLEWNKIKVSDVMNNMFNYNLKLILKWKISGRNHLIFKNEYQQILSQNTWQKSVLFSDLNFKMRLKDNKSSLNFSVNNIFNSRFFTFINNSDIGIFENNYILQPRMFFLRYEFRF